MKKFKEKLRDIFVGLVKKISQIKRLIEQLDEIRDRSFYSEKLLSKTLNFIESEYELRSVFNTDNIEDYVDQMSRVDFYEQDKIQKNILDALKLKDCTTDHFLCLVCNKWTEMKIDYQSSDGKLPNWRESLICQNCFLNNRQRACLRLAQQAIKNDKFQSVFVMEQVTPFFRSIRQINPQLEIIGSEYLGPKFQPGQIVDGIRHEDISNLSFSSESIDLILSNDVFEHVPSFQDALIECNRVLRKNGLIIASMPFHSCNYESVLRASIKNESLRYHLDPIFHGNPVSGEGCLVYCDFGWDVFQLFKDCGYYAKVHLIANPSTGHLGNNNLIFLLRKEKGLENN